MPFNLQHAMKAVDRQTAIFWFRRDLRLEDNHGLSQALKGNNSVLPLFIFDTNILSKLEDGHDPRVEFIHQTLTQLKTKIEEIGSTLLVLHGDPLNIFEKLNPTALYANHDYEPYARARDQQVKAMLESRNIQFKTFKDQVIFEKDEVVKGDGNPYTIFTPYSKKWRQALNPTSFRAHDLGKLMNNLRKVPPIQMPSLHEIGFKETKVEFPKRLVRKSTIRGYHKTRDFPGINGTTRLSVHLRFGTISIRALARIAKLENDTWLNELIWRDFYQMILWHFPHVANQAFKPAYDRIAWRNNPEEFYCWCSGKTGYPIVDAGMRELNETGFMHNRVRMITASFLTKHLLIDWRWGEAYFASKLLDFDLASNNGGWQWAAGSGCDAAPYFRVFNPYIQAKKFDRDQSYVKKWVAELGTAAYPLPIVDHATARQRALITYKKSLT